LAEKSPTSRGKKARKYGRNTRKPCKVRYTAEKRWIKNKRKKAQKEANKRNYLVRIKINGEWETIHPTKAGEKSPAT